VASPRMPPDPRARPMVGWAMYTSCGRRPVGVYYLCRPNIYISRRRGEEEGIDACMG
jgi:hypothetical protein